MNDVIETTDEAPDTQRMSKSQVDWLRMVCKLEEETLVLDLEETLDGSK